MSETTMPTRGRARRHGLSSVAALATLVAAGLTAATVPALAAGPTSATGSATAGVSGDLTGDGVPDYLTPLFYTGPSNQPGLGVFPVNAAPYSASLDAQSPDGTAWKNYLITRHGSLTGHQLDDLLALNPASHQLYLYPNDGDNGGTPGHFTHPDQARAIAKPACAAPADCTDYDKTWNSTTQVVATTGVLGGAGLPDLVTVENGKLWYYPGKAGSVLGSPVLLGSGDWTGTTVVAPGTVGGVPTLWIRVDSTGAIATRTFGFNADGTPTALLTPPTTTAIASANHHCVDQGDYVGHTDSSCQAPTPWTIAADGTLRSHGECLDSAFAGAPTPGQGLALRPCDGRDTESWTVTQNTVASRSQHQAGLCLTADDTWLTLLSCDGTARQQWGTPQPDGSIQPLPAPAPYSPVSVYQQPSTPYHVSVLTSPGSPDSAGNPRLFANDDWSAYLYPGQASADGTAQFGTRIPLGPGQVNVGSSIHDNPMGAQLVSDGVLYSACTKLTMQADGDLVLSRLSSGATLWHSGTAGHPGASLHVQSDGNLVVYDADHNAVWASGSWGHTGGDLETQDDCNLVMKDGSGTVLWSSRTYDPAFDTSGVPVTAGSVLKSGSSLNAGSVRLDMQTDGNLVMYNQTTGAALWSTGTWNRPGATATMQTDGNFVLYDANHNAVWSTATWGHPGARLVLQHDHNLVIYSADGAPLWSSGTWQQ